MQSSAPKRSKPKKGKKASPEYKDENALISETERRLLAMRDETRAIVIKNASQSEADEKLAAGIACFNRDLGSSFSRIVGSSRTLEQLSYTVDDEATATTLATVSQVLKTGAGKMVKGVATCAEQQGAISDEARAVIHRWAASKYDDDEVGDDLFLSSYKERPSDTRALQYLIDHAAKGRTK